MANTNDGWEIEDLELDGFDGVQEGVSEERESFPSIGYHAGDGNFYIDYPGEDESRVVRELTLSVLGLRSSRRIQKGERFEYYKKFTRSEDIPGDPEPHLQVLCLVDGEPYIFGGGSWTMRGFFTNPPASDKQGHDSRIPEGIWTRLQDYAKKVSKSQGVQLAPYCFNITISPNEDAETLTSKREGNKKSKAYRLQVVGKPQFVGAETAKQYEELYAELDVPAWIADHEGSWGVPGSGSGRVTYNGLQNTVEETPVVEEEPQKTVSEDEIPF